MEYLMTCVRDKLVCRIGYLRRMYSDKPLELKDEKLIEKRRVFWEQEELRDAAVREDLLSPQELKIHRCHLEAIRKGHFTYDDPVTKKREFTRLRHYLRGACCGSACRHCIYDHVKVPDGKIHNKRFNSTFWVYNETDTDEINDEYMMSLRKPKLRPNRSQ